MIFRRKADSLYALFKIIDAFPKVLDFFTINFRMYSKNIGGIKKFCIRFLKNYTIFNKKLDSLVRFWDKYSKVFDRFLKFQTATTKENGTYSSYLWRVIACFFENNSDSFYTLLNFFDNFPKFLGFVTLKFRWHSKGLGRSPQFLCNFFLKIFQSKS